MELKRFDKSFSNLTNFFRKGFYKKPDKFEIDVFGKIVHYQLQVLIITSRLKEDIKEITDNTNYIFNCLEENKKISHSKSVKGIISNEKLRLDLTDFYLYTRVFLDALTVGIKHTFINAGKTECVIGNSVSCFLNEKKMKAYEEKIDSVFFVNLQKHLSWIRTLRDSRGGLVHNYHYVVTTTTRQGELGYEIMDEKKTEWGTDSVKGINNEIQITINNISDLMDFLSMNLPKKQNTKTKSKN